MAEKEEEFNNTRKNHTRAMESLGSSIEAEQRAKGEGLCIKKQLEGEINELEINLDHAMAKLEGKIRELEAELASTQSRTGEAANSFWKAERKAKELAFAGGEAGKGE